MFGDFEKMQAEMQQKLGTITVESVGGDGAVVVTMSAALKITNVKIDASKLNLTDSEQLEDLLVVTINEAIQKAQTKATIETQKMMNDILPGGLGALGGLFKK